jgi:hypothetical protein
MTPDSPALFMGGDFGALVLFNILWLGFLQSKVKGRLGWAPCWFMGRAHRSYRIYAGLSTEPLLHILDHLSGAVEGADCE